MKIEVVKINFSDRLDRPAVIQHVINQVKPALTGSAHPEALAIWGAPLSLNRRDHQALSLPLKGTGAPGILQAGVTTHWTG